mgnify:FL=1|jgi:hypothetical protein
MSKLGNDLLGLFTPLAAILLFGKFQWSVAGEFFQYHCKLGLKAIGSSLANFQFREIVVLHVLIVIHSCL